MNESIGLNEFMVVYMWMMTHILQIENSFLSANKSETKGINKSFLLKLYFMLKVSLSMREKNEQWKNFKFRIDTPQFFHLQRLEDIKYY